MTKRMYGPYLYHHYHFDSGEVVKRFSTMKYHGLNGVWQEERDQSILLNRSGVFRKGFTTAGFEVRDWYTEQMPNGDTLVHFNIVQEEF